MQSTHTTRSGCNSARLTVGDVVLISDPSEGIGVVRHIDEISFIIGIELTDPLGTSDGSRGGERYFKCRPKYGIFVSVSDIVRLVSPEELLHKIVVLNRALAHKHSTLTCKNQMIDKLKKEVLSLKQTLKTYILNQESLNTQIDELNQENIGYKQCQNNSDIIPLNVGNIGNIGNSDDLDPLSLLDSQKKIFSSDLLQQIQTNLDIDTLTDNDDILPPQPLNEEGSVEFDDEILEDLRNNLHSHNRNSLMHNNNSHRASKPQTPDRDESDESDQGKPHSRPPSRRGSFLNEYSHHLYDNHDINRQLILDRGRQINDALSRYKTVKTKRKRRNKHSRDFRDEQLGFVAGLPKPMSPISSHHSHSLSHHSNHSLHSASSQKQKKGHRKGKSTVEIAANKLRKEIHKKSKQILKQQKQKRMLREGDDDEEELLSDEYFVEMSNKFNHSIGNSENTRHIPPIPKRSMSRSQPTSPRRYQLQNELIFDQGQGQGPTLPQFLPKLNTSLSSASGHSKGSQSVIYARPTPANPYAFAAEQPLKPTSIWRKNREAFLKQMDKKLEEVIHRFEAKANGNGNGNGNNEMKMFHSKPLTRKRGHSYHENSEEMQRVIRENSESQKKVYHQTSQSTTFSNHRKYEWMTTKTTFSQYNDKLKQSKEEHKFDIDSVFSKQPTFAMIPRRSISLPSSPHRKPVMINSHISDQSSISDEAEAEAEAEGHGSTEELMPDEDDLYVYRKESQPVQYDRSIRRRRFRRQLKTGNKFTIAARKNRYSDPLSPESNTTSTNPSNTSDNEDMGDMDEAEEDTYYRRTRIKQRRKRYRYKDDSDSDLANQEIIDSSDNEAEAVNEEYIDLDEEHYNYYQTKKRNSLLDKT